MFSRPYQPSTSRARRVITGLALLAYVASVVGYPLPLPAGVELDKSVPFPCQGHACGCQSAGHCWDNCCCYSAAERLAWIRQNGVTVPAATLANLKQAAAEENAAETESEAAKACCQRTHNCDPHKADAAPAGGIVWINAIQAQKCQGLTTLWLASGANLPVEILTLWEFDWRVVAHLSLASEHFFAPAAQPPVPPPWQSV